MRQLLISLLVILVITAAPPAWADAPERTLRDVIIESMVGAAVKS